MAAALRNLRSNEILAYAFLGLCLFGLPRAQAQRVILSEDFESDTPDTQPESADFYARSCVSFINCPNDPAKIVVTGGTFTDPFGPGNQSVVFHNPNSGAQMAITWTSIFEDDPSTFRNGVIEFDLWMDKPLPVIGEPGGKFWSFLDIRTGFGGENRSGVTTTADVTVWDNIRIQNIFEQPEPVESVVDAGAQFSVGLETTYSDPVPNGLMAPDQSFHVKMEFSGTPGNESYVIKLNDTPITWLQDGETSHPWVPDAPGINVLSFLTDASAFFSGGAGNVFLDNLVVINNDLAPLPDLIGDYNDNGVVDAADYVLWRNGGPLQNDPTPGVQAADYDQWKSNFGKTPGLGSAGFIAGVPEPAALLLLAESLMICLCLGSATRANQRK